MGEVHFGWARFDRHLQGFTRSCDPKRATAYETRPRITPIIAGQTTGSDEESSVGPDAALTVPAPKPAPLGLTPRWAPHALSIWPREESVGAWAVVSIPGLILAGKGPLSTAGRRLSSGH